MKKTISINISGVIFNIEEDAYDKLRNYLDTISGYFTDSDGKDEIMMDIESRIAELFQERLGDHKNVVNMKDVDQVVDIMGRPEEYIVEEDQPTKEYSRGQRTKRGKRRVYRDTDKNLLGGVCSGIAHYFAWDPLWVRLIWGLFIFVAGIGVIPYIILWIIIPGAKTTAEKLEMMGEPINVENIKKKVTETYEDFRSKSGDGIDTDFQVQYARDQVSRGGNFIIQILKRIFKFIGGMMGFFFLLAGFAAIMFSIYFWADGSLFQIDGKNWEWSFGELQRGLFTSDLHSYMFFIGAILVGIIPLIGLILLGSWLLFRAPSGTKGLIPSLFAIWIIGLVSLIVSGVGLGKEFSEEESSSERVEISTLGGILFLDVKEDSYFPNSTRWSYNRFPNELMELENDSVYCGYPSMRIIQNVGSDFIEVEVEKESQGFTSEAAYDRAEDISYKYVQVGDTLIFDPQFSFALDDKIRGQQCNVTLRIPEGQLLYIGERAPRILEDAHNRHRLDVEELVRKTWVMTDDGLRSLDDTAEDEEEIESI